MNNWTPNEISILIEHYGDTLNDDLEELFPGRSWVAIYKKATKLGLRRSKEMEFKIRSVASKSKKREKMPERINNNGYRMVLCPEHPRADQGGYVLEHILVYERETGVSVPRNCCIHHLNGDKQDNRIENLCMMEFGAHTRYHHIGSKTSAETRMRISKKAKARLSDKRNHPCYKDVDIDAMRAMRESGAKVSDVCAKFDISKRTYYDKMGGL